MKNKTVRCFLVSVAIALALSGCGGGGSATMPGDGTTGGGTGTGGDTDDGMTGGDPTLTVPEGLARNTELPLVFDTEEPDKSVTFLTFPTLAAGIRRDYDAQRSGLANDTHIKSVSIDLNNDINNNDDLIGLHVTYVVGDEEVTVRFTEDDLDDGRPEAWEKGDYWGWLPRWTQEQDDNLSFIGGIPGYRLYASTGFRTETADLPSGTAVYVGGMRGDSHLTNDPFLSGREAMSGSLRLTANFDAASLEGRISDIRVRPEPPSPKVWSSLPDTTWFMIDNGRIVDGQFTADLTGMDSNANAAANETVRGYEGDVLGEFYGPEAAEVGGVLNASRGDRVMAGAFGGSRQ